MTEEKCILSSSCCGCSLRSGSLAIGITGVILGILGAINGIYHGVKGFNSGWADLIINLIMIAVCGLLIQGIRQERRGFVMAWVWMAAIIIAIDIILGVITFINLNFVGGIIYFIVIGFAIYCVLVVRSYAFSIGSSPTMA